jgi:hypothetical protein
MALTDDQKKLNDELEREARLRKEISESLTEYVKAVKDSKKLAKEIADLEAKKTAEATKLADMQNGIILATAVEIQKQQDLVDVLEHQNEVLKDNKRILDKTIGSINKYQLASQRAFVKGGAQMVKTFLNLDNIIENAYGKLKGFGLFEMDKAMKNTAVNTFIPLKPNLMYMIRKWRSKNTKYEKSGSFNVELYLDYLAVINDYSTK